MVGGFRLQQQHGKGRVRVSRVWRKAAGDGRADVIVEWNVSISLLSDCLEAYTDGNNSSIVATDTMKNTVYAKAKECTEVESPEGFAIRLAKHFTSFYPQVTTAIISIVEKPWERAVVDGQSHVHGFKLGSEKHTTEVNLKKHGPLRLVSGIQGLSLLKTTQSGFEGFIRDRYTLLPETKERMLATEVTALWRFQFESISSVPTKSIFFIERYQDVKKLLVDTFFGPPNSGIYSPSVQNTLYLMAAAVLNRFPDIASIQMRMPNLHFLPVNLSSKDNPNLVKFADDVYLPTDEPHGTIEATLSRPLSKL
ncbi:uricase-2 isozyme 2 [Phalaenopsis equestris]|uniref:uricase-2 isozyme 2 n=1 Tax=Phalaenopsis equestris TaxID=78828 RepID=UPI0009E3679C|nr:uricase-2 isozyme 2 [Phalaenopsis equestris]